MLILEETRSLKEDFDRISNNKSRNHIKQKRGNYMNRPAIIFFDIDGTLLDFGKKDLSPKTREALLKLRANGIRICIATGRSPLAVPKFEGVEFDAYLTYNGCYCYEGSKTIYSNPMSLEDVQTIIQNAASMERALSVATKDRLISNGTDPDLEEYYAFGNQKVTISDEFDEVSRGEVYQLLMACRKEEYAQVLQNTQEAKITSWWDRAVDIIPTGGGKGTGISKMLEYYGIDRSQAMAFGDGNNDIEMFQAVDMGVAMENASDDLKAVAADTCDHVAEDGVYRYCVKHSLI